MFGNTVSGRSDNVLQQNKQARLPRKNDFCFECALAGKTFNLLFEQFNNNNNNINNNNNVQVVLILTGLNSALHFTNLI